MDPVAAALSLLQADSTDTLSKVAAKQSTSDALAASQHADDAAGADVASAKSKQNADLDAAKSLLESTFRVS